MSQSRSVNPLPYSDFRSDTATAPTPEMFAAMMKSSLGDDVYNEDDSVKKLEHYVSLLTGHEAAIFCTSGTMSNQLAHRVHLCNPPQSAIVDIRSHVFNYEAGGISVHSQAAVYPIMPSNGKYLTIEDVSSRIVLDVDVHFAPTRVVSLENTLNGTIMPIEEIVKIREFTKKHGIRLHLDGARLWHASIVTGISLKEYCSYFDTVSLCLSKGIGAPIGSILVGSESVIKKARHFRLLFGGGWRQAGMLAEAALWGIETNWPTMKDAHRRAKILERAFEEIGCRITNPVDTNMVWVDTTNAGFTVDVLMKELAKEGIKISGSGCATRVVLHYQITDEVVERFIQVLLKVANLSRLMTDADLPEPPIFKQSIGKYEDIEESVTAIAMALPSTAISNSQKPSTKGAPRNLSDSDTSGAHRRNMPSMTGCFFEDRDSQERFAENYSNIVNSSDVNSMATNKSQYTYLKDIEQREQDEARIPRSMPKSQSLNFLAVDKKISKLQYRMAHSSASKALKRASSRLARWSGLLPREA
ncbi:Threonine aldolase [Entomortierella lignicola]|nr:Threonine aldolase [Entomortierella lignicola]